MRGGLPGRERPPDARTDPVETAPPVAPVAAQAPDLVFDSGSAAPADPLAGFPVAKPGTPFVERMLEALDKYRPMTGTGPEAETRHPDGHL